MTRRVTVIVRRRRDLIHGVASMQFVIREEGSSHAEWGERVLEIGGLFPANCEAGYVQGRLKTTA